MPQGLAGKARMMFPLFEEYPRLRERLPRVALAKLPTPVAPMLRLGEALGLDRLYVKRDDLSDAEYGGNKPRKLEFALGKALHEGRRAVLTFGGAGSNHTLATTIYARRAGLGSIAMLVPQPNAHALRRNLLMSLLRGAELHYHRGMPGVVIGTLWQLLRHRVQDGRRPLLIPPGGSNALGVLGHVNAGLELKRQIDAGEVPEPDRLYVACGSMGTSVGLLLGLALAGLRTRVTAVRVTARIYVSGKKARRFFHGANRLLHAADASIPLLPFPEARFELRHDYFGEEYARYTEASMRAVRLARETESLSLEGTYTGKTLACLMGDAAAGALHGKAVLFWNTHTSRDFAPEAAGVDYHALPAPLRGYFERDVQPLDR